ncbi:MAG: bifunctional isocitrate dehydrogenase kinase/phosphatase [Myxococcaceae bacterium]
MNALDSPPQDPQASLARWGAGMIRAAFDEYLARFRGITGRARRRFEARDWRGHQRDARERLDVVTEVLWATMLRLRTQFGDGVRDKRLWMKMRSLYADMVRELPTVELAETFFNSVTRRIFTTVGVDPDIEFVAPACPPPPSNGPIHRTFIRNGSTEALLAEILRSYAFESPYRDFEGDVKTGAALIDRHFARCGDGRPPEVIELAIPRFYRGKGAYLVGRALHNGETIPFILALLHVEDGVYLDAVLPTYKDARVLFSFARSYFHVNIERPYDLVDFLQSILPIRRKSELYISIGYNKHGKTELYRDILAHLSTTDERFELAQGDRGLVMIVFTLPSLELVFKVIRSRFLPPKSTSRTEVKNKYKLVFRQDRAGRLADAQEFEFLAFDAGRFAPDLLMELLSEASDTVRVEGNTVIIQHLYVEKRVRPLNLFLREAGAADAREALNDYGQAIRDLAATNTFPGDLLLKNFGVTLNGRVIFYDYDELTLVTECNFRDLPTASTDEEEMSGEPWFYVGPNDIFPEEFIRFLGLTPEQEQAFLSAHRDLLTSSFWREMQARVQAGEIVDVFPYPPDRRLSGGEATTH